MKKTPYIIHVHRQRIDRNRKHGTDDPPIIIRRGATRVAYAHEVELVGKSKMVYSPHKPLDCGARLWIEAENFEVIR